MVFLCILVQPFTRNLEFFGNAFKNENKMTDVKHVAQFYIYLLFMAFFSYK